MLWAFFFLTEKVTQLGCRGPFRNDTLAIKVYVRSDPLVWLALAQRETSPPLTCQAILQSLLVKALASDPTLSIGPIEVYQPLDQINLLLAPIRALRRRLLERAVVGRLRDKVTAFWHLLTEVLALELTEYLRMDARFAHHIRQHLLTINSRWNLLTLLHLPVLISIIIET